MFEFLKKKTSDDNSKKNETYIEIACLLVHASKIDEKYTKSEREIVKKTLISLGCEEIATDSVINSAEELESNSNQILDFTRSLKNVEKEKKIILIESLWRIIYSDNRSDMYEANLMRRLTGLLYLDPKEVGDIKEKIIKELNR